MNAGSYLYSFSPHLRPAGFSSHRRSTTIAADLHTRDLQHLCFRIRFPAAQDVVRRENVRAYAELKGGKKGYGAPVTEPVKLKNGAVLRDVGLDTSASSVSWWEEFPKRWTIVIMCFSAFLLCNMDRIAGGILADTIGGKKVLGFGVVWWSIATVLTPIAAKLGLPFLLVVRAFMGIGEGVAMPAMNNILSKWVPVSERSRSLALVYSGMYLGSVTGLAFSPFLIHQFGWPSVFFSFGSLGTVWFAIWTTKAYSSPAEDPNLRPEEKKYILASCASKNTVKTIPWRLILSKPPVWALIVCHFCHNWGTFILLTWMPTYYHQVLKMNLTDSGLLSVLPWLTMAFSANFGGWIADTLISRGLSVTTVRKVPLYLSQGADAFSQSGLYSNHQDIAPRYSGVLLGLSNTAGVLAGVLGTAATGYILQHGSWDNVFEVSVGLYLVGTVVWNLFSTGEKILD
ncbi:Sodium-dependent phosphate transport protein 1, chloroplastic [Linum perenne]